MTLLSRLQDAPVGTRELDREVAAVVNQGPFIETIGTNKFEIDPPDYTTSLDAALALAERVLPDHEWSVGCLPVSDDADYEEHHNFGALLYSRYTKPYDAMAHGATPALALCAAIIAAKEGT